MDDYRLSLLFENRGGHVARIEVMSIIHEPQGHHVVTQECRSIEELEDCVGLLKQDLDRALKEARRKFAQPQPPPFPDNS
ncbi:MAG: hypothetical protein ABW277_09075 [Longimicrobiaceae bacterium]